jgi:hypothetical protein
MNTILKMIGRVVVIVLVISLIGAGLYFAFNNGAGQALLANDRGGFEGGRGQFRPGANALGQLLPNGQSGGFGRGGDFGERGGSRFSLSRGLPGILYDLGIVAAVTVGVLLLQKLWQAIFRKKITAAA